jgi:hypothetical protein
MQPSLSRSHDQESLSILTENLLAVHRRALERVPQTVQTAMEAMEATLALERVLTLRAHLSLLLALADGALGGPRAAEVPAPLRAAVLLARGKVLGELDRVPESRADLEQALALAGGASDASLARDIVCERARLALRVISGDSRGEAGGWG